MGLDVYVDVVMPAVAGHQRIGHKPIGTTRAPSASSRYCRRTPSSWPVFLTCFLFWVPVSGDAFNGTLLEAGSHAEPDQDGPTALLQTTMSSFSMAESASKSTAEAGANRTAVEAADGIMLNQQSSMVRMASPMAKRWGNGNQYNKYRQAMVNFGDVQFISYITIGKQIISGILDTGSFELVVFSKNCPSCGRAGKYDSQASKTYTQGKLASGQSYGSGDTYSIEAFDQIMIGPRKNNQTFWEVMDAHMPILSHAAFQSIIGVGPPETPAADAWSAAKQAARNVTDVLGKGMVTTPELRKKVTDKITIAQEMSRRTTMLNTFGVHLFSICMGAVPGADGYFIWNDTTALEKPQIFVKVPVMGKHTWSVQLRNVRLEMSGKRIPGKPRDSRAPPQGPLLGCADGCSALIDSGTSLIAVPTFVINQLLQAMENMAANCSLMDELPDLVFQLNGTQFSLPADAYVAEVQGSVPQFLASFVRVRNLHKMGGQCQLVLMESFADSMFGPLWILGVPFFRKYYTTFEIGATKKDRALHISPAGADCVPTNDSTKAPGTRPFLRQIDPSKLYVPQTVQRAATSQFVNI